MPSQRAKEGYLQIDHRESPGVNSLLAPHPDRPIVGRGVNFETATVRCTQCHKIVILNPDRQRPRTWCPKCDGYHCDACVAVHPFGECVTLEAIFEVRQREAELLIPTKGSE